MPVKHLAHARTWTPNHASRAVHSPHIAVERRPTGRKDWSAEGGCRCKFGRTYLIGIDRTLPHFGMRVIEEVHDGLPVSGVDAAEVRVGL